MRVHFFVAFWEAIAQPSCTSSDEAVHFKYMTNMMSLPARRGVQALARTLSQRGSAVPVGRELTPD